MAGRRILVTGVANPYGARLAARLLDDPAGLGPEAAGDRSLVLELSERIRGTIQERVYENLVEREGAFI